MFFILCIPQPRVLDCHSASETERAIDDNRTAVISAMQPCPLPELGRSKACDFPTSALQFIKFSKRHVFGTEIIQQQTHRHFSGLCSEQSVEDLVAKTAVVPNVHAEVDRPFRVVNRV